MDRDPLIAKHLELIQGVVDRLASNSFSLKSWAVLLAAAVLGVGGKSDVPMAFYSIALVPICVFWGLDGFFLAHRRQFEALYEYWAEKLGTSPEETAQALFSMNRTGIACPQGTWLNAVASTTLLFFYVGLAALCMAVGWCLAK